MYSNPWYFIGDVDLPAFTDGHPVADIRFQRTRHRSDMRYATGIFQPGELIRNCKRKVQ